MSELTTSTSKALKGTETDFKKLKKDLEKTLIKTVHAPLILQKKGSIISDYDQKIDNAVKDGKSAITSIVNQLDTSIKGDGRKALEETVNKHKDDYDKV
ncbi:hypothetical protein [Streptococcus loxodontisalivarius]|uniref:Urocanate hydratase n=1 Tax=Streptococcus loxodontisalivarius TaxID=1349415 RepID=A0ABS2PTA3_9STRE|nr:hypothetical protein [Streptococcus loxodontisalivarius]MBM7642739.1 urocanate hydratase [Streptococcus loxodontisalivarius]